MWEDALIHKGDNLNEEWCSKEILESDSMKDEPHSSVVDAVEDPIIDAIPTEIPQIQVEAVVAPLRRSTRERKSAISSIYEKGRYSVFIVLAHSTFSSDIVRTSVLSTKWRYKWVSVPHLIFNDKCIPVSDGSLGHDKLVKIINHVLLLHRGPILTFKISSSQLQTCSEIDCWILYLLLSSLTEFKLQISRSERYNVLPCLFSFRQLIRLTLVGCRIVSPETFRGFSCLTSLVFEKVTLSNATLNCLVSTCPQLEELTVIDIDGPIQIELSNPKLKFLQIHGKFIGICLKDLRLLVSASFIALTAAHPDQWRTCNISNILGSLLGIQKLGMGGWFLQVIEPCAFNIYSEIGTHSFMFTSACILLQSLAVGDVARRLPSTTYNHLKRISFALNPKDMKVVLVAICLLNSSPNLQELKILVTFL
ncbi:F-box/FBD/LRR-repeat protein At1g13570-like [Telopea speciosissima]|uniref:F-box/FBD/LRR-repeat protein At1g13570-like n=1 Tax=Telopea speciosissima TaxID=54955 RepID=UPI001CC5A132|nr:F-box/FBD/LRR-repeat protein At1g13570-like [Telopea speciosissima]